METIKFTPSEIKEDGKTPLKRFKGNIVLRVPTCDEAMEFMSEATSLQGGDQASGTIKMMKMAEPLYHEVDIKVGEKVFSSYEELKEDGRNLPLLMAVCTKAMNELFSPSKK